MMKTSEIANLLKAKVLAQGDDFMIDNLLLDSRKLNHTESSLFIPLVTQRRNAHQFIKDVYQSGVRVFIVSEPIETAFYPNAWFLLVENTLSALQQLATLHRAQFDVPVIGITGSNGKTIVKEWVTSTIK
jgi:UDP-N-acetylmuramyl pentapeptide synthase